MMERDTIMAAISQTEELLRLLTRLETLGMSGVRDTDRWAPDLEAEARQHLRAILDLFATAKQMELV